MRTPSGPAPALMLLLAAASAASAFAGARPEAAERKSLVGPNQERVDVAVRKELVYEICLNDGLQYQRTFCPEAVDTLYLLADTDAAILVKWAGVYYWPATREYLGDWTAWNEEIPGDLEITRARDAARRAERHDFALYYPEGYAGTASSMLIDRDAVAAIESQERATAAYNGALALYQKQWERYARLMASYQADPKSFGMTPPAEPKPPSAPKSYLPPLENGFVVHLPAGAYRLRLLDRQGRTIPRTEKRLIVISAQAEGVAYQITPEEKWTYPIRSDSSDEAILGRPNHVIYLKPYRALQFNRHDYLRLTQLRTPAAGRGLENQKHWLLTDPLPSAGFRLEMTRGRLTVERIAEKPYYVHQNPGYVLGYRIVEFDPHELPGREPSFSAYRVVLPADRGSFGLRLCTPEGTIVASSVRDLRAVAQPGLAPVIAVALLPLLAGLLLHLLRGRARTRSRDR